MPPANLHRMRPLLLTIALLTATLVCAQGPEPDSTAALSFSSSCSLPMNHVQVYAAALEAWQVTFGREPGAALDVKDPEGAALEGRAYIRFRSTQLIGREETMGIISYHVRIQARNGECRILVTDIRHVGNRNSRMGATSVGLLTNASAPPQKVRGMGHKNGVMLWNELKEVAERDIKELERRFGSHLRESTEP